MKFEMNWMWNMDVVVSMEGHWIPNGSLWTQNGLFWIQCDHVDPREGPWRVPKGQREEVMEWNRDDVMNDVMVSTRCHWTSIGSLWGHM